MKGKDMEPITAVTPGTGEAAVAPPMAISQSEADAIGESFDLDGYDQLQVYWVRGPRGLQALIQPMKMGFEREH